MSDPAEDLLSFFVFDFEHLPAKLQIISKLYADLAADIVRLTPAGAERTTAMRKLLESKDCAVRAL